MAPRVALPPASPAARPSLRLLLPLLPPLLAAAAFPPLNTTTVARAEALVMAAFGLPAEGSYGAYCNPCALGDAIGPLVRLPFHDAIGGGRPSGKGGANGCIDFSAPGNSGLQAAVGNLSAAFDAGGLGALMSRADFFVLAGNVALRVASTLPKGRSPDGGLPVPAAPLLAPFRYGREDDASCDGVDAAFLPGPGLSYAQMAAVFCARVGMTPRQLVAIMGAHSLGRARAAETNGYDGSWSGFSSSLSIAYYVQLAGVFWSNKDAPMPDSWLAAPPAPGPPTDAPLINLKSPDVELIISPSDNCPQFNELNFSQPTPAPQPGTACPVNAINVEVVKSYIANQTLCWCRIAPSLIYSFAHPTFK